MPVIQTTGWPLAQVATSRFLHVGGGLKIPVYCKAFAAPRDNFHVVYPCARLTPSHWQLFIGCCRRHGQFDPAQKFWVFTSLALDNSSSENGQSRPVVVLTKQQREAVKEKRKASEALFNEQLLELSKAENVPESLWPSYAYPPHLKATDPQPTALQRIVVSRYWNQPSALFGASVGTGKSRMVVDILSARALAPNAPRLNDSARIVLLVAPLSLHENWKREFHKWRRNNVSWAVHRFNPSKSFWEDFEESCVEFFDGRKMKTGGVVIVCTHQALSRRTLIEQLKERGIVPTALVIDEVQRFFRKPDNNAYKNVAEIRKNVFVTIGLSGTPTSKFEDWWALEELICRDIPDAHWKASSYFDYQRLGDRDTFTSSNLHLKGWDYERGIKEYHADRIRKGRLFMASKEHYMKDSLPGLEQEEIGEFADLRLNFHQLFNDHPDWVKAAFELQRAQNQGFKGSDSTMATVLLLRMQQLAAISGDNSLLLKDFVDEFLDKDEPCVFWCMFRNPPCEELPETVKFLSSLAPTTWLMGGMIEKERWEAIDGFTKGKYRFFVAQTEAGGVGLNLIRACKQLFLSIPFGYQAVNQCIGRQHRIGQEKDVTSYFAMTSPVAAFARSIYDRRVDLNEAIPQQISGLLSQFAPPTIIDNSLAGAPAAL